MKRERERDGIGDRVESEAWVEDVWVLKEYETGVCKRTSHKKGR